MSARGGLTFAPLGDAAWRFERPRDLPNGPALEALRAVAGVRDAALTEHAGLVAFDGIPPDPGAIAAALDVARERSEASRGRAHTIQVALDGPDLALVEAATGLDRDALAATLAAAPLHVSFLGFQPGFAYLRGLPQALALPRRESPRARVPAHALALGGGFAGVYPFEGPGGWQLVGRALDFSPLGPTGAAWAAGDRVRLVPSSASAASAPSAASSRLHARTQGPPALVVVRAPAPAFVQDLGRPGHLHEGVPRGGALDPAALAGANLRVGNAPSAAGLERFGPLTLEARTPLRLATDTGERVTLGPGDTWALDWSRGRRVGYVAVAGGLDVPPALGGLGTHVAARLGGHEGRALRAGDALAVHPQGPHDPPLGPAPRVSPSADVPITLRVVPGPDAASFVPSALDTLLTATFTVHAHSDRTGIRLSGPPLRRAPGAPESVTAPMVPGALEVPPSGEAIVLGPDHPATGGYPVLAAVVRLDLGRLGALPPGAAVRFCAIDAEAARRERLLLASRA